MSSLDYFEGGSAALETPQLTPLLRYLGTLEVERAHGGQVREELARVPLLLLDAVLDELARRGMQVDDHLALLRLLSCDEREHVRVQVAGEVACVEPPLTSGVGTILWELAVDPSHSVRQMAAAALANVLRRTDPLTRLRLVCSWAVDSEPRRRLALARALAASVGGVGVLSVLEVLVSDSDPRVKFAARYAALVQGFGVLEAQPTAFEMEIAG